MALPVTPPERAMAMQPRPGDASTTRSASSLVMRPPEPVPVTSVSEIPFSARSLRTIGDSTWGPTPSPLVATSGVDLVGAGAGAGGGVGAGGGGGGRWRWRWRWRWSRLSRRSRCGLRSRRSCRRWLGLPHRSRWRTLGRRGTGTVADHRQPHAYLDGLALGDEDLAENSRRGRGHLGVNLVRGDLEEGLVPLDCVADSLHPASDRSLGHRLAELRHHDVSQRAIPFRSTRAWSHRMSRTRRGVAE